MKTKLFLDDVRQPPDDSWVLVKNYAECVEALNSQSWDVVSLDHDLADEHYIDTDWEYDEPVFKEKTGYEVCKYIVENNLWPYQQIIIHSWNPIGADRMSKLLSAYAPGDLSIINKKAASFP